MLISFIQKKVFKFNHKPCCINNLFGL